MLWTMRTRNNILCFFKGVQHIEYVSNAAHFFDYKETFAVKI